MSKTKRIIKWSAISILTLVVSVFTFGYWFLSLIPSAESRADLKDTRSVDLAYLTNNKVSPRGRILIVVTSTDEMGPGGKKTGYELTELARPYYIFQANGFEVDIASPRGGEPPAVIDGDDMGAFDYAFLNDPTAQAKVKQTIRLDIADPEIYQAIFFAGGKGAMWDFPDHPGIQAMVRDYYQTGKVVGAVCHGPAALVNVTLDNGQPLISGKAVTGFTNSEELFLIPDAHEIFPFLLQDKMMEKGAQFDDGLVYLENVVHEGNLITGQNPWSTFTVAETMIREMGFIPKPRIRTGEENAVDVLVQYELHGYDEASQLISTLVSERELMDRTLLAMHSIVAAMQLDLGKTADLIGLVKHAKSLQAG